MKKNTSSSTPLMDQYLRIKARHQNAILLYRMGDFYETFYEDAQVISKVLGIALTKRAHGKSADVPLAGFPYHALDNYLPKLVKKGHRVAICEQVEDPKLARGIVRRDVVEVVTPGATLSEKLLDAKRNNFLAAACTEAGTAGLAWVDVSTGEFFAGEVPAARTVEELTSFHPAEILLASGDRSLEEELAKRMPQVVMTRRDDWIFTDQFAQETLINHFRVHSLKGFGLDKWPTAARAAGVIVHYLKENHQSSPGHIQHIRILNLSDHMILDPATRRNLEIQSTLREDAGGNTLLDVLDSTKTAMGGRLLRNWLNQPLKNLKEIRNRQNAVAELFDSPGLLKKLQQLLSEISDLERLIGKIATGRANPRDVVNLKNSLEIIPSIREVLRKEAPEELRKQFEKMDDLKKLSGLIAGALVEDPPMALGEGHIFRSGYHEDLDELRALMHHGKSWIAELQDTERQRTGISSLKISYNKVFGYYIEVSRVNLARIPENYIRKQTLVNAERFITPELKEQEEKVLGAEERVKQLEYELFQQLRNEIGAEISAVQANSRMLARLDCLCSLAHAARENGYVRPELDEGRALNIEDSRHPVVEKYMKPGEQFIPNSVSLDPDSEQIWIITGPNMAGKSTFLRQIGLIVFMAQIGSFVPVKSARIGLIDRIFTRVGASDNLAGGESTFLIEMNETANILHNAGDRSLVLLDEIGRGTSTFDGLAIAWAVTEFIYKQKDIRAKTLFATHYHELTELAMLYPRIKNYNVAVEEIEKEIIFLRRIVPGGTDNSYGIHVAQMAGLPAAVIERAREILSNLEANELMPNRMPRLARRRSGRQTDEDQLMLFQLPPVSEVEKKLDTLDIQRLTPLDALVELDKLKKLLRKTST